MCPHTTIYTRPHTTICVLILLHTRPHTPMCPDTSICVAPYIHARGRQEGSCRISNIRLLYTRPHTTICVLILPYVCPHTTIYYYICVAPYMREAGEKEAAVYPIYGYCIHVLILLYVSWYYNICVAPYMREVGKKEVASSGHARDRCIINVSRYTFSPHTLVA